MYESLIQPIEAIAATLIEGIVELFGDDGSKLRRPRENKGVKLPEDLFAHPEVQTEWWYYTGHCETESGKRFGFELVFFKRRTDLDRVGIVPLRILANPMYAAHFAISEIGKQHFKYEHIRSFDSLFDLPVSVSDERYDLRLGPWTVREDVGSHILHAEFKDGFVFDAVLDAAKPVVRHGDGGTGTGRKEADAASSHFSFTRMHAAGMVAKNGLEEKFTGTAWMDKEFGTWDQKNWDWFSIQLDDETELMIYNFRGETDETEPFSSGTFVEKDGSQSHLDRGDFSLEPTKFWKSPKTHAVYPGGWKIVVPKLGIELDINPLIDNQELDTRTTTTIVYWEGCCEAKGTRKGQTSRGRAYVELVGYERSHETTSLSTFLFSDPLLRLVGLG